MVIRFVVAIFELLRKSEISDDKGKKLKKEIKFFVGQKEKKEERKKKNDGLNTIVKKDSNTAKLGHKPRKQESSETITIMTNFRPCRNASTSHPLGGRVSS